MARPTRTAWAYFKSREVATQCFDSFNSGGCRVCGLSIKAETLVAQDPDQQDGRWKMNLVGLSVNTTWEDITYAMHLPDNPCQVDIGDPSYDIDLEMDSTLIKSMLYDVGPLERWHVFGNPKARRIKAQPTFFEESQAQSAVSSLNGKELPFNSAGKLFVQLITSVKFKVSIRVYDVVKHRVNSLKAEWDRQFVRFTLVERVYNRILKLEGEDRQLVAQAKKDLEHIITGTVMIIDGKVIWCPDFRTDRSAYRKLRKIESDLEVVIIRDVRASDFRVFGQEDKFTPAAEAFHHLIEEIECSNRSKKTTSPPEIQKHLLPEAFENILEASFVSFIHRHPTDFRYCPTPDCDQVYRVASSGKVPPLFTCARCFTANCTACHASHPGVSCAKYKGDNCDGVEELVKAKEELGVKDCPMCTTPIQKSEGCNHMTCGGCGVHICWVCMATFRKESDCYVHLAKLHGGFTWWLQLRTKKNPQLL